MKFQAMGDPQNPVILFFHAMGVKKAYPYGNFPVFENHNHMQMQILDPKGFAAMLDSIICTGKIMLGGE